MKNIIAIFFTLSLIFSTQLFAKKFTVAIDTWKPFVYIENDKPKGLTIDIFNKLAKKLNYDIEFKYIPWTRALKMMESGEVDAIGNLSFSKEREKYIAYTQLPFYELKTRFYTLINSDITIKKHEDLYQYLFLVGSEYVYYPKFDNDKNINKISVRDRVNDKLTIDASEIMVNMLMKKRVKILISANTIMEHTLSQLSLKNVIKELPYIPSAYDFQYIGISKKSPFMKDLTKINEAIEEIVN